ncbi:MAG TPA: vWA domain-containing protein [Verrucomicrobiota bacterium]|nr:vWA domain-containing protein [Verrucomicrobiota bacterium]
MHTSSSARRGRLRAGVHAAVALLALTLLCGVRAFEGFDVFVLLDTSGSMAAKGRTNLVNIFPEVKQRLINDIKSRRTGDYVAIYTFDEGRPRLLAAKTIGAQADYAFFEEKLTALQANGAYTFLDLCCYETFTNASHYARTHTNHLVELRVYTDGSNTGPPMTPAQRDLVKLHLGELPYLLFNYCLYNQPGETNPPPPWLPVQPLSPDTVFVRVDPGSGDLGNLRAQGFQRDFPMVTYFDQDVRGRPMYCEAVIDRIISHGQPEYPGKLIPNLSPRPIEITDKAYHLMFELANGREVPEEARVAFSGRIVFRAADVAAKPGQTPPVPLSFVPRSVPIKGRVGPQSVLAFSVEGVTGAVLDAGVGHLSLTRREIIHTDRGLRPILLRCVLAEQVRVRPEDKLILEVSTPDSELAEFPVARFLVSPTESGEGQRVFTAGSDTKEFFLRVDYRPQHLAKISGPGYYPVEIRVRSSAEDLVGEFSFVGTAAGARQPLGLLRFFPGRAPGLRDYAPAPGGAPGEAVPKDLVSRIEPPPAVGWKLLVILAEAVALFAVLQFLCFVPRGTSAVAAAALAGVAWFFGGWTGFLILPQEPLDAWVWGGLGLLAVPFILWPWCFSVTPWFGGWTLNGRPLREIARAKRRRAVFLVPGSDKLTIRVGGPRKFDVSDTAYDSLEVTLIFPAGRGALVPGRKLRLVANSPNVRLGTRQLQTMESLQLDDGARLRVKGKDLEFRCQ